MAKNNTITYKVLTLIFAIAIIGLIYGMFSMLSSDNHQDNPTIVVIETSIGNIKVQLNETAAPITTANFLSYVNDGFYDGTIFHRVIKGFMIQGGGFTSNGTQKETKAPIKLESDNGLNNKVGTIAMARTNDPNSATSQFFINVADNTFLDYTSSNPGYAVFGKVIEGMDVVNEIETVETSPKGYFNDWPVEDVTIIKVYVENE